MNITVDALTDSNVIFGYGQVTKLNVYFRSVTKVNYLDCLSVFSYPWKVIFYRLGLSCIKIMSLSNFCWLRMCVRFQCCRDKSLILTGTQGNTVFLYITFFLNLLKVICFQVALSRLSFTFFDYYVLYKFN